MLRSGPLQCDRWTRTNRLFVPPQPTLCMKLQARSDVAAGHRPRLRECREALRGHRGLSKLPNVRGAVLCQEESAADARARCGRRGWRSSPHRDTPGAGARQERGAGHVRCGQPISVHPTHVPDSVCEWMWLSASRTIQGGRLREGLGDPPAPRCPTPAVGQTRGLAKFGERRRRCLACGHRQIRFC